MKSFLLVSLFFLPLFFSCTKEDVIQPVSRPAADNTHEVVFSSFSGERSGTAVTLQFITSRQKHVKYFEVYSGTDEHQLCAIGRLQPGPTDNRTTNLYIYRDPQPKGDPSYYMIGYVKEDGSLNFFNQLLEVSSTGNN